MMNWMFAAILICGATVFTACTNDDNPGGDTPVAPESYETVL